MCESDKVLPCNHCLVSFPFTGVLPQLSKQGEGGWEKKKIHSSRENGSTITLLLLLFEIEVSYRSVFRSLCSVPVFHSFHVPCGCVGSCLFVVHVVSLVYSILGFPRNISRYSSVSQIPVSYPTR